MPRRILIGCVLLVFLTGCPIARTSRPANKLIRGVERSNLMVRVLGRTDGSAVWVTTGSDGKPGNRRFDEQHVLVDPGSRADVEAYERHLIGDGLPLGERIDVVVLTRDDSDAYAGLRALEKRWTVGKVVGVAEPEPAGPAARRIRRPSPDFKPEQFNYGGSLPGHLNLGGEITARVLGVPEGGTATAGLFLRFIDLQLLVVAAPPRETLLEPTLLIPTRASTGLSRFHPEIGVGNGLDQGEHDDEHAEPVLFPAPAAGDVLVIETNGNEAMLPGPTYRNRHGFFVACDAGARCEPELKATVDGALLVQLEVPEGTPGWFLLDTRSKVSFVAETRFHRLPGAAHAEIHDHSHGEKPTGFPLPPVRLSGAMVHGFRVRPIPDAALGGEAVAGILGRDFLESFHLHVEPRAGRLRLTPAIADEPLPRLPEPVVEENGASRRYEVPMDWSPAGPLILARLDGTARSLVVSTGADRSYVSLPQAEKETWESVRGPFLRLEDMNYPEWELGPRQVASREIAQLDLNGVTFESIPVWVPERPQQTDLLGMDFLRRFERVTFDFRRRKLILETGTP